MPKQPDIDITEKHEPSEEERLFLAVVYAKNKKGRIAEMIRQLEEYYREAEREFEDANEAWLDSKALLSLLKWRKRKYHQE